jgi:hypothetical protein
VVPPRAAPQAQLLAALPAAPTRLAVYVFIPHLPLVVMAADLLDAIAELWRHQALIKVSAFKGYFFLFRIIGLETFHGDLGGWFSRYDFTHLGCCFSGKLTWIG